MTSHGETSAGLAGPAEARVGDAEREAAVVHLKEHFVSGRLSSPEFEDRIMRVLAAVRASDLAEALHDLPDVSMPSPRVRRSQEYLRLPRRAVKVAAVGVGAGLAAACLNLGSQALAADPDEPVCAVTMKPSTSRDGSCPVPERVGSGEARSSGSGREQARLDAGLDR